MLFWFEYLILPLNFFQTRNIFLVFHLKYHEFVVYIPTKCVKTPSWFVCCFTVVLLSFLKKKSQFEYGVVKVIVRGTFKNSLFLRKH